MYYRILVASQRFHGTESLTYSSAQPLGVGQLAQVELQRKLVTGIVEAQAPKPDFNTKALVYSWDVSLPETSLRLLKWLYEYYPAPLGMITELFTPPAMPKKLQEISNKQHPLAAPSLPPLTADQAKAMEQINHAKSHTVLLHGDTGSGKTRVYLELARQTLSQGSSALILTPEIGLTEPLLQGFREQFGERVVVTHSQMTPAERRKNWLRIAQSNEPMVVVGPRSALFSPIKQLGLIVMDEMHDTAYKQEQAPYYQSSRVAGRLAALHGARLIMGSATPPINDYFTFQHKQLPIIRMTQLAIESNHVTPQTIIDHRDKTQFSRSPWISNALLAATEQALENNEQTMFFLNRRGSARVVMCENCGWQAMCPHCDIPLTFHQDQYVMRCHSCDYRDSPPSICPDCGVSELVYKSIGTKALETELHRLFPKARIARFDRDTEKTERLHHLYDELKTGTIDLIVGTQAIVKGFDLPKLSVVGIINADSGLQIPDFTASERSFQLISQVSGRIGRGHRAGQLFVQSYQPDSPLLRLALEKNYSGFLKQELRQRELYKFPPYYFLLKITCSRASAASAQSACKKIADDLRLRYTNCIVEGPAPRFIEKQAGKYAWHIIVKARNRRVLQDIAKDLPANSVGDLDPDNLL